MDILIIKIMGRHFHNIQCEERGHFHKLLCEEMIFPLPKGKNDGLRYEVIIFSRGFIRKSLYKIFEQINEKFCAGINGYFCIKKILNFNGNVRFNDFWYTKINMTQIWYDEFNQLAPKFAAEQHEEKRSLYSSNLVKKFTKFENF